MKDTSVPAHTPPVSRRGRLLQMGSVVLVLAVIGISAVRAAQGSSAMTESLVRVFSVPQDTVVSFARDVFPILERSCVECHGAPDENGEPVVEEGLNMLTYDGLIAGSLYGTVVEPGNVEESYMMELLTAGDMPKEGDPLSPEEIELIRRWILAGAPNN